MMSRSRSQGTEVTIVTGAFSKLLVCALLNKTQEKRNKEIN